MAKFKALDGFAITASGNTAPFDVASVRDLEVAISVAASTGTNPQLDLWMRSSSDGGVTWYDRPADKVLKTSDTAGGNTVEENVRNLITAKRSAAAERFLAVFTALAADYIAFFWVAGGTSPSFPTTITVIPK